MGKDNERKKYSREQGLNKKKARETTEKKVFN
jgi:hypothetical protein